MKLSLIAKELQTVNRPFFELPCEPVGGTYLSMNGFARRLVLTPRQQASRKGPI